MDIDFAKKQIRLSVTEFTNFAQSAYPRTAKGIAGQWSSLIGQYWHNKHWDELNEEPGVKAKREVPIQGTLSLQGWSFILNGRIDQLSMEGTEHHIRELKSVQTLLPASPELLRKKYQEYFEQVSCYQLMYSAKQEDQKVITLSSELLFIHAETGIYQSVPITGDPIDMIKHRASCWVDYLEGLHKRQHATSNYNDIHAFDEYRPEQIETREKLHQKISDNKGARFYFLEAPTGFGKTALSIETALQALSKDDIQRCLFLTGKNSGQKQFLNELAQIHSKFSNICYYQIRNRNTLTEACPHLQCPCSHEIIDENLPLGGELKPYLHWQRGMEILDTGSPHNELLIKIAQNEHYCPRLLNQTLITQAEIAICDYNYVFSSIARGVIDQNPLHSPELTILIIDEAHNLAERVAALFSFKLESSVLDAISNKLTQLIQDTECHTVLNSLQSWLNGIKKSEGVKEQTAETFIDHVKQVNIKLQKHLFVFFKLEAEEIDWINQLLSMGDSLSSDDLVFHVWAEQPATLNIDCIDASAYIYKLLKQYAKVLMMSATFPGSEYYEETTGIPARKMELIQGTSTWRETAYDVAIDLRVDTRFKKRAEHHLLTSDTAAILTQYTTQPVIVFFPSYLYAETIITYLQTTHPEISSYVVPRGYPTEEQLLFLEDALMQHQVIGIALGGGLSESIDMLGGRVDTVMVVSPALPDFGPVTKAKEKRLSAEDAFNNLFLLPGLTKVNQALGRIVRNPEQSARVLLHCKRFQRTDYFDKLAPEYQTDQTIHNQQDLENWLNKKGQPEG